MHMWTQHVSSNVLPCWFLVSGKPAAWLFDTLLLPGYETKNLRDCWGITTLRFIVRFIVHFTFQWWFNSLRNIKDLKP